jgi:hypothetical protein
MDVNLLVAVKSCHKDRALGFHDVIRQTWGRGLNVRFFMGLPVEERNTFEGPHVNSDEKILDCKDDYENLPYKTQAICRWVIERAYNFVFICDTDTFIMPDKLMHSRFEQFDYAGKISRSFNDKFYYAAVDRNGKIEKHENCMPWASGGFGYILSRSGCKIVAEEKPVSWAEDLSVGQLIMPEVHAGRLLALDIPAGRVSLHFPSHEYKSGYDLSFEWMEQEWEKYIRE